MRFKVYGRSEFVDTRRKRLALERGRRRQREKLPLLAPIIREEQECTTPDEVMAARAEQWARTEQEWRDRRASDWRRARARLASYGENVRPRLLAYWQSCKWPGDPVYLLSMMHMFDEGRLDIDETPAPASWKDQ